MKTTLSELVEDDLVDLEARLLVRHERLDALGFEPAGVEVFQHRPLRAEHSQSRIPLTLRHRRDRIDDVDERSVDRCFDRRGALVHEVRSDRDSLSAAVDETLRRRHKRCIIARPIVGDLQLPDICEVAWSRAGSAPNDDRRAA